MSELCSRQESCPIVLRACELRVKAEAKARLAAANAAALQADYDAKRSVMNELFASAVACRKAQGEYFKLRTQENLTAARRAEKRLDDAIAACRDHGKKPKPAQGQLQGI